MVHEEDSDQPQGTVYKEAHDYVTADEAEHNDEQYQIPADNKNGLLVPGDIKEEDIDAYETKHNYDDLNDLMVKSLWP